MCGKVTGHGGNNEGAPERARALEVAKVLGILSHFRLARFTLLGGQQDYSRRSQWSGGPSVDEQQRQRTDFAYFLISVSEASCAEGDTCNSNT